VIFLDTSAIYPLTDQNDTDHEEAHRIFGRIVEERTPLLTHNYVVVEAMALIQRRLGLAAAIHFENSTRNFEMVWVDQEIHREAVLRWAKGRRTLSFVDALSFTVMKRHQTDTAFAFDSDFVAAGFNVLTAAPRR